MQQPLGEVGRQLLQDFPVIRALREYDRKGFNELINLAENCADFTRRYAEPRALEIDERVEQDPEYFDWDLVRDICKYRLFSLAIPTVIGGLAGKYMLTMVNLVVEELCSTCAGIGNIIAA